MAAYRIETWLDQSSFNYEYNWAVYKIKLFAEPDPPKKPLMTGSASYRWSARWHARRAARKMARGFKPGTEMRRVERYDTSGGGIFRGLL